MELSNIQQRGSSLLVDITRNGKRHRVTCESMPEALAVRDKILNKMLTDQSPNRCWTLQQAFDKAMPVYWRGFANEKNAVRNAQEALAFFGVDTPLNDITTDWIDQWIEKLDAEGGAPATINKKVAALSKMLTHARECSDDSGYTKRPKVRRQREEEGRIRFLETTEEQIVRDHFSHWGLDDHAEVVCVLADTGLRHSECWRFSERDVNFSVGKHGTITTWKTKNHKPRTIPLTLRASEIIKRRIEFTVKGEPIFPFNNRWLNRAWARVRTKMKLDGDKQFVSYALRHTCASRLVQRGVPLKVVQEWMGHKTIEITLRYAHLSPDNLIDAVKVLEQ